MRQKQLLGVLLVVLMVSTMAAAAGPQLTSVNVTGQAQASTLVLHTSGAFTHTEYRPVDNMLLVDLSGVQPGTLRDTNKSVNLPGVISYRVLGYTGNRGGEVTRLEMTLDPGAVVNVSEVANGLQVHVTMADDAAAPMKPVQSSKPSAQQPKVVAASKPAETKAAPATMTASTEPVMVRNVAVTRGANGMQVEISASGPVTPQTQTLTDPDRVVVDLLNALPAAHQKPIMVNGADIKSVRMARFQDDPPVTRIVVDLTSACEYEVTPVGNKVVLKLKGAHAPAATELPLHTPARPSATLVPAAITSESPRPQVIAAAYKPAADTPKAQSAASEIVAVEPKWEAKPAVTEQKQVSAAQTVAKAEAPRNAEPSVLPAASAAIGAPAVNLALQQAQQRATAPAQAGQRYTGEPISVNLKDVDLKDFFRLIHEISGLNIVLDPNVHGTLTLVLDDVPWDQALDIVLQNNGLDRRLEGNVLRIATRDTFTNEAESRRKQAEAIALAVDKVQVTHFLSYAHAQDVMPIVKRFLSARGDVVADPRTNALIINDIPSTLPDVQRLLNQLDRKTQEVEIEARVVSATRNFARDIGVQLGFGWGNQNNAVGGAGAVGNSPLLPGYTSAPPYFTSPSVPPLATPPPNPVPVTGATIPLFSNFPAVGPTSGLSFLHLGSDYRIDTVLTMAESKGLLKILSRPRVVTQNNIGATVKQGVKIPVVTAAQLGGPPTTTYVDAELRLQVTPQITIENTIFLNVDVENTSPDFGHQVQGNPTLLTQQATTQVLVTDGGTVVIGGVIQTQNSVSTSQTPLLGDIPILGNLFKRRSVSTQTQELIFFITPKIVQT